MPGKSERDTMGNGQGGHDGASGQGNTLTASVDGDEGIVQGISQYHDQVASEAAKCLTSNDAPKEQCDNDGVASDKKPEDADQSDNLLTEDEGKVDCVDVEQDLETNNDSSTVQTEVSIESVAKGEEAGSNAGTVESVSARLITGEEPAGSFGDIMESQNATQTQTENNLCNEQAECDNSEVTPERANNMNFFEAASWLDEEKIEYDLEDLDDMRALIKQKLKEREMIRKASSSDSDDHSSQVPLTDSQRMMRDILARDQEMKEELYHVYKELVNFVHPDTIGQDVHEVLSETYSDYKTTIGSYMSQLVNEACPIVVAGETSAGKSSLLNLILGSEVLPHSLLCATSTICRLHHSDTKFFKVNEEDTVMEIDSNGQGAEESLSEKLKEFISSAESRRNHKYKVVDIFWPIPMLKDLKRVTIVDTPGVGESAEMTQRVLDYLPNAVAFIYVINSANATGIQNDKLLHIINEQKRWEREGKLSSFDCESTLFVCNQWDRVEKSKEVEKVWKQTLHKLRNALPGLKEEKVFKMSTLEAARYIKCGLGHTEKFRVLLEGIQQMVPESLKAKVRQHFRWLEKFLSTIQSVITGRITHARSTEEDKQKLLDSVLNRLTKLSMDSEKVKEELIAAAKEECNNIIDKLYQYLHDDAVRARLCDWREDDAPDIGGGDFEVTRFNADRIILCRVQEELKAWESQEGLIKRLSDKLTNLFYSKCHLLGQECTKVDLMIEGFTSDSDLHSVIGNVDFGGHLDKPLFTGSEKAILVVAAPLWIPLVTAASLLFLPVGVGMLIRESLKANKQRKDYLGNKAQFMVEWTEKLMQTAFTRDNLEKFIYATYFDSFQMKIDELCKDFIPKQIEADKKQVIHIHEDTRTSKEILSQFLPLQNKLKDVLGQFHLFELQFMAEDLIDIKNLERVRSLGKGNFSDVVLVNWKRGDGKKQVALKILRRSLTGCAVYSQLTEVSCHRKLKHPNIVELYGISYSYSGDCVGEGAAKQLVDAGGDIEREKTLMLLLEYCEETLEDKVFKNKRWQCGSFNTVESRHEAFQFYIQMGVGICGGLAYIHNAGYLHRDLKLSNVLVKNNMAKICDLGFAKLESLVAGTFVGTVSHMSPELSGGKGYNWSTDIYSLGILLWELWYGRHAYSEPEYAHFSIPALLDMIRVDKGHRPKLTYMYQMMDDLKRVTEDCWAFEPTTRPKASEVRSRLQQLAIKYSPQESKECDPADGR